MRAYYEDLWERLPAQRAVPNERLRARFLDEQLKAQPGVGLALDLGCGDGRLTGLLARRARSVIGVDVAQAALARARARHPQLDFRLIGPDGQLPLKDASVEVVWSSEVIEHVADTARWLSEVRRVLAPGGRLLATTPDHGRLRLLVWGIERCAPPLGDHLHLYTRRALRGLLREFDFEAISVRAAGGLPGMRRLLLASASRPALGGRAGARWGAERAGDGDARPA